MNENKSLGYRIYSDIEENNEEIDNEQYYCELTWQDRIIGYCICTLLGTAISFCSFSRITSALHGDPTEFAIFLSIGNIISISGSLFLSGPTNQCNSMFQENRYIISTIYLVSILGVFIIIYLPNFSGKIVWLIFTIILQYLSWGWYTISYIPYARNIIKKCLF